MDTDWTLTIRPSLRSTPIEPVITAEQALLGALLLQPDLAPAIARTVSAADFYRPAHAALFDALANDSHRGGEAITDRVLRLLGAAGQQAAGLTAVYAHTLMAACRKPANAPTYARVVAEAAATRRIHEHAVRLGQVARTDRERGGVDETLRHLDALHRVLDQTRTAHPPLRGTARPTPAPTPTPTPPLLVDGEVPVEEEMLLRSLVANPAELDAVRWLEPDDFAHPPHAALFGCIRTLHRRGDPVDPVTVVWEAHTAGHLTDLRLDAQAVAELVADGIGINAAYEGRHVVRHALLRRAGQCAAHVAALASAARLPVHHLARAAQRQLSPAEAVRRRWRTATHPDTAPSDKQMTTTRPRPRGPTALHSQVPAAAHFATRR